MTEQSIQNTALSDYLGEGFKDWAGHRAKTKDIEWLKNYEAFTAESSDTWRAEAEKKKGTNDNWKSDVFIRTTKIKTVMAYAMLCDLTLQGGEIPFDLQPIEDDYSEEELEMAKDAADSMKKKIKNQLRATKAIKEVMKVLMSMCLYGGGWIKTPVYKELVNTGWRKTQYGEGVGGFEQFTESEIIPHPQYRTTWDIFADPEFDSPDEGRGIYDRLMVSPFTLKKLKGRPGYDDDSIDEAIDRAGHNTTVDTGSLSPGQREVGKRKRTIRFLTYYGRVPADLFEGFTNKAGKTFSETFNYEWNEDTGDEVEIIVSMADDIVIRVMDNEDGKRPLHYCPFEEILDELLGIGIPDNLRDAQKIQNGAYRMYLDNLALSGNVILGEIGSMKSPGQEGDRLYPGLRIKFNEETDVRKALFGITIPNVSDQIAPLIDRTKEIADDESQLPRGLHGEVEDKAHTLGEVQILQSNAGKYIGQVARNEDEYIFEPMIKDYYDYNMMQDANEAMGSFRIHALGFGTYQNKIQKVNALKTLLAIALQDPELLRELDKREILQDFAKALDADPEQYLLTDQENMERQEAEQQAILEEEQRQAALIDQQADDELERQLTLEGAKAKIDETKEANKLGGEIIKEALKPEKETAKPTAKAKPKAKPKAKKKKAA